MWDAKDGTDHVRNKEKLPTVKEKRNVLHTIKRKKVNWIGHILRLKLPTETRY